MTRMYPGAFGAGLVGVFSLMFMASLAAWGQGRADVPGTEPANPRTMPVPAPAPAPGYGGLSPYTFGTPYVRDYPFMEIQTVPVAKARATAARLEWDRAQTAMISAVRQAEREFERSPEMVAAVKEEREAYDALQLARQKAMLPVVEDPQYQALRKLQSDLSERISDARATVEPGVLHTPELVALAKVKLQFAQQASAMESGLIRGSAEVETARKRLIAAGSKGVELRARFAEQVRVDPKLIAARRAVEDGRIAYVTADAFLQYAIRAAEIAMSYAYYLQRPDPYRSTYRYLDYPYSNYSPYRY